MKYLRPDLKVEFERYIHHHPDIEGFTTPLMNISDVLLAYFILADYFSDPTADGIEDHMLVGVRDINLLASALGRQNCSFSGRSKYTKPLDICSTLFFGLVKDHAFSDGNKRTALLTLLYQLDCYGYKPISSQKNFEKLVVAVASNKLETVYRKEWKHAVSKDLTDKSVEVISHLLKQMTQKKDNSFHIDITARDLIHAIEKIDGCTCDINSGKIKFQRRFTKRTAFFRSETVTKSLCIPYRGDTRTIGAGTVRDVLNTLDLYEQFSCYQSFVEGADPRYMLISQFEGPLRRLKDR